MPITQDRFLTIVDGSAFLYETLREIEEMTKIKPEIFATANSLIDRLEDPVAKEILQEFLGVVNGIRDLLREHGWNINEISTQARVEQKYFARMKNANDRAARYQRQRRNNLEPTNNLLPENEILPSPSSILPSPLAMANSPATKDEDLLRLKQRFERGEIDAELYLKLEGEILSNSVQNKFNPNPNESKSIRRNSNIKSLESLGLDVEKLRQLDEEERKLISGNDLI